MSINVPPFSFFISFISKMNILINPQFLQFDYSLSIHSTEEGMLRIKITELR